MKRITAVVLVAFLPCVFLVLADDQYRKRTDLTNHFVTKIPWILEHSLNILQCARFCANHADCVFLAFNHQSLDCHVFREDNNTWSTEQRINHYWLYFEEENMNITFSTKSVECGTDGYVTIDSHCFKVHEESKTFDDAKSTCDMEGGRMAVIDNQTTALALNDHIRANHTSLVGYLLGLTDREVEGEWRWENGDLLGDYPKFNRLQPNDNDRRYNNQGADCGYMSVVWHLLHKAIDQLYDDICSHPANFVCERVIV